MEAYNQRKREETQKRKKRKKKEVQVSWCMGKKLLKYLPFVIIILVVLSISYFRLFENYELATLDLRYKLRPAQPVNPDVVIVEIGDDSIEKIGRWPFDRNWHATLLSVLAEYGVRAVFFDVMFSEKGAGDPELINASGKIDTYYPFAFDLAQNDTSIPQARGYAAPLLAEFSKAAKATGHINTPVDSDGKIRRVPIQIEYEGKLYPALSFALACDYLGVSKEDLGVPTDEKSSLILNYPPTWKDSYKHLSYIDIIVSHYRESQGQKTTLDLKELKGKVCFVGLTATGTHDMTAVPTESVYPAMGVQATTFNTLVTGRFITRVSRLVNTLIVVILCLIVGAFALRFKPFVSLGLVISIGILFVAVAFGLFAFLRIWLDLFFPIALMALTHLYSTFYKYTTERRKRELIEKELTIAKSIQQSFLPDAIPEAGKLEVGVNMLTAKHVGGDLYDFVDYGDGVLGAMIGDVSGKGVPAALFMAQVVSAFRMLSRDKKEPASVLKDLNKELVTTGKSNLFVTMSYALIDSVNKEAILASGGHLPMLLIRDGKAETFSPKEGLALGLFDSEFSQDRIKLLEGDLLVFYTDGVTEAMNAKNEEFEMTRLSNLIIQHKDLNCKEIINLLYKEIKKFAGKKLQHDDITVIAVKV